MTVAVTHLRACHAAAETITAALVVLIIIIITITTVYYANKAAHINFLVLLLPTCLLVVDYFG